VNPDVVSLIAEYLEVPEIEVHGLISHLRINGWIIVPIPTEVVASREAEEQDG
jgi:hypothetical protein